MVLLYLFLFFICYFFPRFVVYLFISTIVFYFVLSDVFGAIVHGFIFLLLFFLIFTFFLICSFFLFNSILIISLWRPRCNSAWFYFICSFILFLFWLSFLTLSHLYLCLFFSNCRLLVRWLIPSDLLLFFLFYIFIYLSVSTVYSFFFIQFYFIYFSLTSSVQ